MDLKDFLSEYPNLEILNSSQQNDELLSFMEKSPMRIGGIELLYDRRPIFNRLLQCQCGIYFTLIARGTKKQVMGLFSLSVTKKFIHGEKINCAYIGDFRTDGSRQAAHLWRKEYARLIEILKKDGYKNLKSIVTKENIESSYIEYKAEDYYIAYKISKVLGIDSLIESKDVSEKIKVYIK